MDSFYIGRLSGTKGVVWQYTAIDVASSYTWAEVRVTPKNPAPRVPPPWLIASPKTSPAKSGSWRR